MTRTGTTVCLIWFSLQFILSNAIAQSAASAISSSVNKIDLAGEWKFQIDSLDEGLEQKWFIKNLEDRIKLPGSMTTNGKGNDVSFNTNWTGSIFDSSWFFKSEYSQYRKEDNIKVPFWLQPVKYYKGAAWYQKTVNIPASWKHKNIELFIECSHWETTVWVDGKQVGMQNALGTPQVFGLTNQLTPGNHKITICIDNRIKAINVGENSHSISDHTQGNWNGMVGKIFIAARPSVYIQNIQLNPDLRSKRVGVRLKIMNISGKPAKSNIQLLVSSNNQRAEKLKWMKWDIECTPGNNVIDTIYSMGNHPLLWSEFDPNLYSAKIILTNGKDNRDEKSETFGMREFSSQGSQFTINGNLTFLRGSLECAIFPKTGFPPTDIDSWIKFLRYVSAMALIICVSIHGALLKLPLTLLMPRAFTCRLSALHGLIRALL
jgi:beta-galactosidase/beta-glucuronidase